MPYIVDLGGNLLITIKTSKAELINQCRLKVPVSDPQPEIELAEAPFNEHGDAEAANQYHPIIYLR
jgi:hypothetical protein